MSIWNPDAYHGHRKGHHYFEGWFFKVVDASTNHAFAFIPGVFLDKDPEIAHAFIQVLDGQTNRSTYHRYPLSTFRAAKNVFDVWIGNSHFQADEIRLDIDSEGRKVQGTLKFEGITPYPVSLFSPGIMGPYAFAPLMQCYHGVVSLHHSIRGTLHLDEQALNFDGGIGYTEKDWGKGFPKGYVWLQCNHFEGYPKMCFMGSVAHIPWVTGAFRGFLFALHLPDGEILRFTTYTGAKLNYVRITDTTVSMEIQQRSYTLQVEAVRTNGGLLLAPYGRDMIVKIAETLRSEVQLKLWKNKDLLIDAQGIVAGMDVNGESVEIAG
jgi:hypothetical protein